MDKKEELISLKKQFLEEICEYEKRIVWFLIAIGAGLTVYFYKYPDVSWKCVAVFSAVTVLFYEKAMFKGIVKRFNDLKKEIETETITDLKTIPDGFTDNIIVGAFKEESCGTKILLGVYFLIASISLALILKPFVYPSLTKIFGF